MCVYIYKPRVSVFNTLVEKKTLRALCFVCLRVLVVSQFFVLDDCLKNESTCDSAELLMIQEEKHDEVEMKYYVQMYMFFVIRAESSFLGKKEENRK